MATAVRRALVYMGCCLAGLAVWPVPAPGEVLSSEVARPAEQSPSSLSSLENTLFVEAKRLRSEEEVREEPKEAGSATPPSGASPSESSSSAEGTGASPLEGTLLPPGLPRIDAEQAEAERQAKLASPEAVAAREESELKYSGLSAGEAGKTVRETFPQVTEEPAGGPPKLSADESITHFPTANIAQVKGSAGERSVIEATAPMAVKTANGLAPIDLGLSEEGNAFVPKTPLVGVQIPKQLSQGVSLADTGVSLVPVDERGDPLGGSEGSIDGVTVMYANTQTDTDTLVKPTTSGFDMDTVLRSIDSPTELYYKVAMPQGANLVEDNGSGSMRVVDAGTTIAQILAPAARDAEGTSVPLSVRLVSGDIIGVTLTSFTGGRYKLPIVVDPEAEDPVWSNGYYNYRTEWFFYNQYGPDFTAPAAPEGGSWKETISGSHNSEEWAGLYYTTRGESQIMRAHVEGHWNDSGSSIYNLVELQVPNSPHTEDYDFMPEVTEERGWGGYACEPALKCPETTAGSGSPENNNTAGYVQEAHGAGGGHGGENTLTKGYVDIYQKNGPELEFNTTSATIYNSKTGEYVPNVLYGSGEWLGPHHGGFEVRAKDPGIGLSLYRVGTAGWADNKYFYDDEECYGIQCPSFDYQGYTYKTGMANGEDSFEALAEDYVGLYKDIYPEKIKVDAAPPHGIKIIGLQSGDELPMGEPHLKIEATSGEGTTKSPGIKSIKASIDGREVASSAASCSEGPCTAATELTLLTRDYTPGTHSLVVTATDNADNVDQEEFTLRVHAPSAVSIGPGAVDPTYGQFTLSSTDVSLDGLSGVSRTYESRTPTAGASGPLGPQWTIGLGGGEGLTERANGNVELIASGASTVFTRNSKGEFESPSNSGNLKLEAKEKESGKGISEYVLSDSSTGTKTKFAQPQGALSVTPTFGSRFGSEAGQLKHPISDAVDPSGNVWVVSNESDLIEKFSPTGVLLATYGSEGTGPGQYVSPWGIAIDPRNGNVYVSDRGNNRIEEFSSSGSFIKAFGWGVNKSGKAEFEICTAECKAGIAGSGNGQFSTVTGLAVDSSGNVWVADYGNNRIEEFNEKGEYQKKFGSKGTSSEEFEGPTDIALSGGNLYITDYRNNRVQEFSTAGTNLGHIGEAGSENGKFSFPYGIAAEPNTGNLYVVDSGNHRVQEFSAAGAFMTKFGSSGSGQGQFTTPQGVAVSASGRIYVVDSGANLIDEWGRPVWLPAESGGPLSATATTYTYTAVEAEEKVVIEPKEALAPIPSGVSSCTPMVAGCRSLTFEYAKETTATGENPTEWGSYKGHLEKVWFHGYSTASKEIVKVEVARYEYDSKGRLRVEWDPRLEHPLKTTYGYDAEGHVTSLTPPGQQPWMFVYGTAVGDSNAGRLLKVTRAHPKAGWPEEKVKERLKEQASLPKSTEAPKITGTPAVGVRLGVSNGEWTNNPVVYGYQWEDCNSSGGGCAPILGATNQNYTPASADVGHKLVVNVTAIDGGGAVAASSAASTTVVSKVGMFEQAIDSGHSINAVSCIPSTTDCVLSDSAGKALYATAVSVSAEATWKTWSGPSGESPSQAVDCPATSVCLLADGKEAAGGKLYYATSLGGSFSEAYNPVYGVDAISCASASFCVDGQDGLGYFRYSTNPASTAWSLEKQGEATMKGVYCLSSSFCVIADGNGRVHVATSTGQIESSTWTETDVDGSTALNGIACTSTTSCVAVDGVGNAIKLTVEGSGTATASKHNIDGTTNLTAVTCAGSSTCAAVDYAGNVFVSKDGGESWTKEYALGDKLTSVSCASSSLCATADTSGNVTAFNPGGGSGVEGESDAPQPGATIEYAIPASGAGAPYNLSEEEVRKWAQADDAVEGVAIFPPDEPQTWPASGYKRATVRYWDKHGRTVNTVSPTGGVTTSEYDEANEVVRTLSADNRATALKEGCVSVEKKECLSAGASEKLATSIEYNKEEAGIAKETNIVKVTGPEHKVKLSTGEEVEARSVTHDYYNENAKEAEEKNKETYDQLTKITNGALLSSGEEKDTHTTVTSYSGQEDLGWKLRKPTSVTTDPAGLSLTMTTVYSPVTGNVVETRAPEATSAYSQLNYTSAFGSKGKENGQFEFPTLSAMTSSGDIWVVDSTEDRVQEFNSKGEYQTQFGAAGTGGGQFKFPFGIAIEPGGGNIVVADREQARIEVFSSSGTFIRTFGWGVSNGESKLETCTKECRAGLRGGGTGQLENADGVALDSSGNVWVVDETRNRVVEYSETGEFIKQFGTKGSEPGQISQPVGIAYDRGNFYITEAKNERVQEFSTSGTYVARFGSEGSGAAQFKTPYAIAAAPTSGDLYVTDRENNRVEKFTAAGTFITSFGMKGKGTGQFEAPTGVVVGEGEIAYISDHNNQRVQEWTPATTNAHETQTIYYTSKEEAEVSACRNHPEWANLVCRTQPTAQPESGLPELPVTTITSYNLWDDAEITEQKYGTGTKAVTRTEKQTYDPAGRALTSEETASPEHDTALPIVTNEYNTETGRLEKQSATIAGKTKTITSTYNTLGQLVEYTDAEGNVAKYTYEEGSDGRLQEISEGKGEEAQGNQKYTYNTTTGLVEKLVDTASGMGTAEGTFTASYDVEGKMTSEIYPNGMCANTTYNSVGEPTNLEYIKTRTCTEKEAPVWFSDSIIPAIHGETLQQTSTLAKEKYKYDTAGRLTEAQETPAGKGCMSRLYAYDEESNRTSLTTRESATETCATEGGTVQNHSYDGANRPIDSGVEYETFGNATKMPAADAGEHQIVSTYYVDSQIATEAQNEQLSTYVYDPAGRTMETVTENEKTKAKSTVISHYGAGGLSWTCKEEGKAECAEGKGQWTRNIVGIEGGLVAIQETGKSAILQLHDLQGNIVATAEDNETATKVISAYNSTEFGVPQSGTTPPKYAWLGADGASTEPAQAAGTSTSGGSAYIPEIRRPLQTGPIASPGEFPNGTGGVGRVEAPYLAAAAGQSKEIAAREGAAREETERREAEERAKLEERPASETQVDGPGEGNCEADCVTALTAEASGEVGDPNGCHLTAWNPEETQVDGTDVLAADGRFECNRNLSQGQFQVCMEDMTTHRAICETAKHLSSREGFKSVKVICTFGHFYSTFVWLWEPPKGSKGMSLWSPKETECLNEDLEEEGGGEAFEPV